ncbi:MAG: Asp-tRNA(Asn)/Glu-tRNA(Gln) amidotransferase subunit GatC [Candidatus Dormibacteria bacterium]
MPLTSEDVHHVALLARLGLDAEQSERLGTELERILDHISALQVADVSDVPETAQVGNLVNVWREDAAAPSLTREQALANAPSSDGEHLTIGAIQE